MIAPRKRVTSGEALQALGTESLRTAQKDMREDVADRAKLLTKIERRSQANPFRQGEFVMVGVKNRDRLDLNVDYLMKQGLIEELAAPENRPELKAYVVTVKGKDVAMEIAAIVDVFGDGVWMGMRRM